METIIYTVSRIDGDYAYLVADERPELEEKCVARALLPAEINEGVKLKYEFLQYEIL
ncbi:MAG: chorismate--pyruvate lyase [Lachnospiraceae bacterium]|nr:chorismate--pyruvate lyase [Lachnospiraceae bacterium]